MHDNHVLKSFLLHNIAIKYMINNFKTYMMVQIRRNLFKVCNILHASIIVETYSQLYFTKLQIVSHFNEYKY